MRQAEGTMTKTADLVIVGLGAVGSATLYQSAKRGARVVGIDRFQPPHNQGSSHGDTRITRQAIGEGRDFVPLVLRSNQIWEELESATGCSLLTRNGGLILAPEAVASWIPTLDDARPVVEARTIYLPQRLSMPPDERQLRQRLFEWVSGRARYEAPEATLALSSLNVETIAIRDDVASATIREQLARIQNYGVATRVGEYLVYARR